MRVTGGLDRGRKLKAPRGSKTRPTSAKVREALFNILGTPSEDDVVLDLFAGTGALGLEALSRGAGRAVFVERDGRALATLHRNLAELGLADRAEVVGRDVHQAVRLLMERGDSFTWVFMDPPYAALDHGAQALRAVGCGLLRPDGVLVFEHSKRQMPPDVSGGLAVMDRRVYGDTALSFYRCGGGLAA